MSGLPEGWADASIRDVVCEFETADPKKTPDKPFRYVDIGAIDNSVQRITAPKEFLGAEAPSRARRVIKTDDVLFSTVRTYLRNVAQVQEELDGELTSTGISVLRTNEVADPGYLFRWVCSSAFIDEISQSQDGTLYPAVKDEDVLGGPIPLPPLPEQRRIVRKLDTLSARTTTARTHLTAIAKLVEHYRAAVLLSAFTGKLTADLREDLGETAEVTITDPFTHTQIAPKAWKQHLFSEVCKIVGGSQPPKSNFVYHPQDGYIRLIQIRDYKSDAKATYIPTELARRFCTATDIMIGRYGPPIFQILRGLEGSYNVALMKAEPTEAVDQEFLFWYLHHPVLFKYVEVDSKRTAGQDGVNKKHLERWPIMLPPIEEQREIVRRIETAFTKIDRLAAEAEKALKLTDRLDQRILAKAFAGELVPQDPTDEPATELLARIRQTRATAPKPKRGRRKKVAT